LLGGSCKKAASLDFQKVSSEVGMGSWDGDLEGELLTMGGDGWTHGPFF
jgi:hypothetical protein